MNATERKEAIEHMRTIGRKGGVATRRKRGKKHYQAIGARGGTSRWRNKRSSQLSGE